MRSRAQALMRCLSVFQKMTQQFPKTEMIEAVPGQVGTENLDLPDQIKRSLVVNQEAEHLEVRQESNKVVQGIRVLPKENLQVQELTKAQDSPVHLKKGPQVEKGTVQEAQVHLRDIKAHQDHLDVQLEEAHLLLNNGKEGRVKMNISIICAKLLNHQGKQQLHLLLL